MIAPFAPEPGDHPYCKHKGEEKEAIQCHELEKINQDYIHTTYSVKACI